MRYRIAAVLMAGGLLATACGGGSPPEGTPADALAQARAYAGCMRAHGVKNYPDPVKGPDGTVTQSGYGVNLNSPQAIAALHACQPLEPGGTGNTGSLSAGQEKPYLSWAACIRPHGVPMFPDPTFSDGQVSYPQTVNDTTRGALTSAMRACNHYLTGVPGGDPFAGTPRQAP